MKSNLNSDDFFVLLGKKFGNQEDRRFSLLGVQFFSDFITQAVEKAGLSPSQVIINVGEKKYFYDVMSIAWPSPQTVLISGLTCKTGDGAFLVGTRRGFKYGRYKDGKYTYPNGLREDFDFKLNMADPNLLDQFAELIQKSLPKNSKYVEKT